MRRLRNKLKEVGEGLAGSLWAVPAALVLAAVGLSYLVEWLDSLVPEGTRAWYLFRGGPESARSVLETIAGSMMTFTGLVFSVTILVLQLASTQFSPRALRTFLEDTPSKITMGIFVGTFIYALMTLRAVQGTSEGLDLEVFVPSLSIWVAVLLLFISVGAFIGFINHIAQSIRPVVVVQRIAERARESLQELYPEGIGDDVETAHATPPDSNPTLIVPHSHASGVLVFVDEEMLLEAADEHGVFIRLTVAPGDFVPHGAPLFEVWGDIERMEIPRLAAAVTIGTDRNVSQDVALGFRELLDVALRALSPSTNDPTTAVASIDQLHDLLRRMARRRFPSPLRKSKEGRACVLLPRLDFDEYVRLAFDELRVFSGQQFQITRRLHAMIEDLLQVAPVFRRHELLRQRMLLNRMIDRSFDEALDRPVAREPDLRGH